MAIKTGMTVRTVKACGALGADGALDLAEGVKGTVLSIEGDTVLVALRDGCGNVYVRGDLLAGCKGRPLKAESLARALAAHRGEATTEETSTSESTETEAAVA